MNQSIKILISAAPVLIISTFYYPNKINMKLLVFALTMMVAAAQPDGTACTGESVACMNSAECCAGSKCKKPKGNNKNKDKDQQRVCVAKKSTTSCLDAGEACLKGNSCCTGLKCIPDKGGNANLRERQLAPKLKTCK
jgi:hypothetical protein